MELSPDYTIFRLRLSLDLETHTANPRDAEAQLTVQVLGSLGSDIPAPFLCQYGGGVMKITII